MRGGNHLSEFAVYALIAVAVAYFGGHMLLREIVNAIQ